MSASRLGAKGDFPPLPRRAVCTCRSAGSRQNSISHVVLVDGIRIPKWRGMTLFLSIFPLDEPRSAGLHARAWPMPAPIAGAYSPIVRTLPMIVIGQASGNRSWAGPALQSTQIDHALGRARIGKAREDGVLLDLLRAGRGQRWREPDPSGCLVVGQALVQEGVEPLSHGAVGDAGLQHDA